MLEKLLILAFSSPLTSHKTCLTQDLFVPTRLTLNQTGQYFTPFSTLDYSSNAFKKINYL